MTGEVIYHDISNLLWKPREGKEFEKLVKELGELPETLNPIPGGYSDDFFKSGLQLITLRHTVEFAILFVRTSKIFNACSCLPAGIEPIDSLDTVRNKFRNAPIVESPNTARPYHINFRLSDSYLERDRKLEILSASVCFGNQDDNPSQILLCRLDSENHPKPNAVDLWWRGFCSRWYKYRPPKDSM